MIAKLKKINRLELLLFGEAWILLWRSWLLIHLVPFRFYSLLLGNPVLLDENSKMELYNIDNSNIKLISVAIRRGVKWAPVEQRCLSQALTACSMLRRRNIPFRSFLGVEKKEQKMAAHAWVISENEFITGRKGHEKFTVVAVFES
jgi:hypothetical protein